MQHRFVMLNFLLPSHQQSPESIHPRMCSLDYPTTCRVFLFSINRLVRLPTLLQMQDVIPGQHSCYHIFVVVAFIQAKVVNSINQLFWSLNYYLIYRLQSHHLIVSVCGSYNNRKRRSTTVTKKATLCSAFTTINRTWASLITAERSFRDSCIKRLPLPLNAKLSVVIFKQQFPGFLKETSFDPLAVDAVNRRSRGIFLSRESLPLAAGSKNVNNSVKCKTKWSGFTPSSPRLLFWSKNRSNQTPQIVRNMPNCIHRGLGGHSFPPVLKSPEESLCLQDPSVISRIGSKRAASEIKDEEEDYEIEILTSGMNLEGGRVLNRMFSKKVFDYPKPPSLIQSLIRAATTGEDIVLVSFGGSGSTALAVLE